MNIFLAALDALAPHFRVRGHTLRLSQHHPFTGTEIDLRQVAAHKQVEFRTIRIRFFRGRWIDFSIENFRPAEIRKLRVLLRHWEIDNHRKHQKQ